MSTVELYTKGATVWIPDPDCVWVSAQILETYRAEDKHLLLLLNNGREIRYPAGSPDELPPLGNPDILEGENDLTALSFLHEPAVLHNLRVRFLDYNSIYTYCIVLVAINPYDQLPIYGKEVIDAYSGQDMTDMEPHIFSVAEEAYRTMTREEKSQSIIISGESGSGKTVSAKFTMRYFAVVGGASERTSVEDGVLASNPIMESIGNAKTTRNDNSSRFGKYIEIGFGKKGEMFGANMRTYLLEKSRVVFQASSERNYHVFYQLCASRALPEMRALRLDSPGEFRYTNQGGDTEIPGVQPHQQMELFTILAAVLHLGNVHIQASGRGGDRSYIDPADRSLAVFSKLLGVDGPQMAHWLCHRRLAVGGEMLVKPMAGQQALEARDALAKHIYGQLFTWTVHRLNSALRAPRGRPLSSIGVLDIYGFETFDRNSFEQFCINYHVFQLEQEEYVREELAWNRIEFSDNQPCINLIEGHLGLLDLLDEECRMPKGSDENWARKLYDQHQSSNPHPHFSKPRMSNIAFIVLHFADAVQYECGGFLDKNRDTVFEEPINILRASQSELVAELFQQLPPGDSVSQSGGTSSSLANGSLRSGMRSHKEHKLTVGFQFRQSLQLLMETLNSTTPHYVRCIKPNDLKEPFVFDPKRAVQQLRACGVLETIRISAAGYPTRWTYEEFFNRYRVLLRGEVQDREQVLASCKLVLPRLIPDPGQYCFGKTKVFFRAGQVALLERLRAERLRAAGVVIQSWVRGWLARLRYSRVRWAARTVQRYCRGALARRLALTLRYTRAALVIQKTYRMVAVRRLFLFIRQATLTVQAFTRGTLARRRYREVRAERAAVALQARVRGWLARRAYQRVRRAVVLTQCCVRRRAARRQLLRLKAEARSVEKYRTLNKGMEVKLMQLQLRADQEARESAALRGTVHSEREAHGAELEALRRAEMQRLTQERQALQSERDVLVKEKEEMSLVLHDLTESQDGVELRAELDDERRKYQGLLREFTRLEQRYDNLRDMSLLTEDPLMERMGVAKASAMKMKGEDLGHAYNAVRVANKFLEVQLSSQCRQLETELEAAKTQLGRPLCGRSSSAQQEELECVRLRREVRELRATVTLRRVLSHAAGGPAPTPPPPVEALSPPPRTQAPGGRLECKKRDEAKLIKILITDRARVHAFCRNTVTAMKAALKKHSSDVNMTALWLKNACLLNDLLMQHSPKKDGSPGSEGLAPLTSDLSDASHALCNLCIQAYQQLLALTEARLHTIIVPAMLESETIPVVVGSVCKLSTSHKRAVSEPKGDAPTMASVLRELGVLHGALSRQAAAPALMEQAFRQLTYLIVASSLNSLLLRKDVCCWSRGIQIRYNVNMLEEWLRSHNLQTGGAVAELEPLIQAAQLLQVGKKTEADAEALVETCNIVKILKLYTPHSDLEEKVTLNFLRSVLSFLKQRSDGRPPQLVMDVRHVFPVTFPYLPPPELRADQLDIPDSLKISFLRRV
ncbi:hypothetical protein NHX12_033392 [Muraenolepis orangiensis]|uniref:Uncharacterized protein n=1 Tax=Muraenolepis orangiensis TaxID=630683 RepID=A0A9Q0E3L1_9TELE|nr:hypothetical protein NHX12_033392 [Muraenolepis orangiensis]